MALGFAAAFSLASLLSSCANIYADHCADAANAEKADDGLKSCDGGFLSPKVQRAGVYKGDDSPRLWTNEDPRRGGFDTSALNVPPGARRGAASGRSAGGAPVAGSMGSDRGDYPADPKTQAADIASIRSVTSIKFDPDEQVEVKFENDKLEYFLQQMLRGALGVDYLPPANIEGSITFRTEQPIPKRQVLQVVRDVLARNGLEMRLFDGVYHIDKPEVLAALGQISTSGRAGERMTRLVQIKKGSASELAGLVRQLVPEDVTLGTDGGDKILIHAQPGDIDKVAELITSLSEGGFGEDRLTIIHLRSAAPEYVVGKLTEVYRGHKEASGDVPTLVPLENQQAILIATKDRRLMEEIKATALRLDTGSGVDDTSLRIIALKHLAADELAPLVSNAVGATGAAATGQANGRGYQGGQAGQGQNWEGQGGQSSGLPAAPLTVPPTSQGVPGFNLGSALSPEGGTSVNGKDEAGQGSAPNSGVGVAPTASTGSSGRNGVGPSVKIVADTRSNALWVYSNYAMFRRISDVVKILDVPQAQVVIEATVAEVDLNDDLQHGVQAFLTYRGITTRSSTDPNPATASTPGQNSTTSGSGGVAHIGLTLGPGASADVVLSALRSVTNTKVISTPYLMVLDGKTARLQIGDQVPIASTTQTATITGTVTVTQQIQVKDTGVILEVTPKIKADNSASLGIDQRVSQVKSAPATGTVDLNPTISTQEIKSDILVQSGRTVLLGGLIKESVQKTDGGIPGAMNLPVLGDLFKQHTDTLIRQELIVMITPRVIRHSSEIENITRLLRSQIPIR